MKILSRLLLPIAIIGLLSVTSCKKLGIGGGGSGDVGDVSSTTGWDYNDPENGGFDVRPYNEQETGPGLVLIEGGTFVMGRVEQDIRYDWNNIPRRITMASYYMDETEIKNVDYREYLYWLQRVFQSYPEVYKKALPDTLVWRRRLAFNEPYVEYYFRHPAYHTYPVVGVDWLQATDYCGWRTDRVNEQILVREGIFDPNPNQVDDDNFNTDAYFAGQYEGLVRQNLENLLDGSERSVQLEDGILLPKYRLPTEAEWEYAALALIGNSYDSPERIYSRRLYPWNGHYARNDTKRDRGLFMANFQRGRGDMMGVAGYLNDNAAITAPVNSYWPNDFGLYCMAGNVNEWVLDVYRPLSYTDVAEFRPFRGNVFIDKERDADGNIAEKDSLGRIKWVEVTDLDRYNYQKADNINYRDGDLQSSIVSGAEYISENEERGSGRMYRQGKSKKTGTDWISLVNDESRVYKGGSWRDRKYWLVPGTRRFLDQNNSRDDLGFRCAMIRVGSPAGY